MGMDRKVLFSVAAPTYGQLRDALASRQLTLQMRMIDGQLAFPDEEPPEGWKEIRVAIAQSMVTLRREADGIRLVTWGNAEAEMLQAWEALTWAVAKSTGGKIEGTG